MKEFMTQKELVCEFMAFLHENKGYYEIWCDVMLPKKNIIDRSLTMEEFAEMIYDFGLLSLGALGSSFHNHDIKTMVSEFAKHFSDKHKEDIKNQYIDTIRLLYRYIRDNKLETTLNTVYGSKREFDEHIIKCQQPIFSCSFPGMVLSSKYICDHNSTALIDEHSKLLHGFYLYYKKIVTEQQQNE